MNSLFGQILAVVTLLGFLFVVPEATIAQEEHTTAFLYKCSFVQYKKQPDRAFTDYMVVMNKGDSTYSQFHGQMRIDSIRSHREMSDVEYAGFTFRNRPKRVTIAGDSLTFNGLVGDDYYVYKEKIEYDWSLMDSTQVINGYACRLAHMTYGGRNWEAWYTQDLPVDVGPYKFKGLPGAIVQIQDFKGLFKFKLVQVKQRDDLPLKPYPSILNQEHIATTRKAFNALEQAFDNLSLNEQLAYSSRGSLGEGGLKIVSNGDDPALRSITTDKPSERFHIENDH